MKEGVYLVEVGKMGKWKRIIDALSGRCIPYDIEKYPQVSVRTMTQTLVGLSDKQWGMYAFSREPLEGKFNTAQKEAYIEKANNCGKEWAKRIISMYNTCSPSIIAKKMGMKVLMPKTPVGGGQVLFAQYVPPNEITIFTDCIEKGVKLSNASGCFLLQEELLKDVLLAHELFHTVEEQYEKEIYTRTEKIELWRKPFSNRSSIVCLSEIAAMSFAKELLGLSCSPYVLDVLLIYSYDKEAAWGLYDEICELTGGERYVDN